MPLRIVLDDATAEFVDFTQGPARFFVHLNGVELATARFAIETRPALADKLNSMVAGAASFGSLAQTISQARDVGSIAGKPVIQARTAKGPVPGSGAAFSGAAHLGIAMACGRGHWQASLASITDKSGVGI